MERIAVEIAERRAGRRRRECVAGEVGVEHLRRPLADGAAGYVEPQEKPRRDNPSRVRSYRLQWSGHRTR